MDKLIIPEFGQFALVIAMSLALIQAIFPLLGAWRGKLSWMNLARSCAYGQFLFIGIAFAILAYAFITNDFSVRYVAENSNTSLPLIYRFCAIWGAHEGSLLLWVFILSIWTALVALLSKNLPPDLIARVLAVLAMISVGFLLFLLMTSDPFTRILPNIPGNGRDLNPLLQDPGLIIHPPMLYMGYVGFSVAFAFAIAALIGGRLDATWARWSRPWTLIAWCFLTFGITLGSWWAYRELGWGGWWFWDPVENASFLPWLVGTALVHSLIVTEKRDAFKAWTALLAICAFSLSLLGTFLVRSGVLISVHAFAVDPARGAFMLKFLGIVVGCSLLLYALRAHAVRGGGVFNLFSRETMLLANNVLLMVAMFSVLLGTLYPLIVEAFGLGKLSVGAPYFNIVFIPIAAFILIMMAPAPILNWRTAKWSNVSLTTIILLPTSVILAIVLPWLFAPKILWQVILGLSLAFWVILATVVGMFRFDQKKIAWRGLTRSRFGMVLAHIGIAVAVIGITLTSNYSVEKQVHMAAGDSVTAGPYTFQFLGVKGLVGPNYRGVEGGVIVAKNGNAFTLLQPQERTYTVQQTTLAKTAINIGLFRDLYVALGEPLSNNQWSLRVYYKPFVRWIWAGGILIMLGALVAVSDRRYRTKAILTKATMTSEL